MAKIIDEFYFKIFQAKRHYEQNVPKEEQDLYLLARVNKALKEYNQTNWEYLKDYFYAEIEIALNTEEVLVMFILFSSYKEKMLDFDVDIVYFLIRSLLKVNINIYNYESYFNMIFDPSVYYHLGKIDKAKIRYIIEAIIMFVSPNEIRIGYYETILKLISELSGEKYSPVFKNDFSIANIYNTLKEFLFSAINKRFLDLLLELENTLSPEDILLFGQEVSNLESIYFENPYQLSQMILSLIKKYYIESKSNLRIIKK